MRLTLELKDGHFHLVTGGLYAPVVHALPEVHLTAANARFEAMKAQLTDWFSDTPAISSAEDRPVVSTAIAPHYTWADVCDGWRLTSAPTLNVIQERMPPGTAEERHRHSRVRQFFFVLGGVLTLEVEGTAHRLGPRQGLEVAPGQAHQARNEGDPDAEFLVISDGISREDRQETL